MSTIVVPLDAIVAQPVATVGVSAAALASGVGVASRIVLLQADPANTGTIYLGDTTNVTAVPALAHTALKAGDWRMFSVNNLSDICAIATVAAQKLLIGVAK